ncbi:MAG: 16S rRNA (adenine(1518)-N(6)/adenine(1519)-N(6))-dimethyltransferase RsmA, partial [Alphaproteobacteria bacterium]|nr:16S rRNA (adenine(1518)-N(6)/adenine(1519)-N(6))-dimethyltransferase RsmA [Alphaproteobacteria bacterium]
LDLNVTRRIVRAAVAGASPVADALVVEIGPGPGGLTRALLEAGARCVLAVERDRRCVEALAALASAYPGRLVVIEGDALSTDIAALARRHGATAAGDVKLVANLPYNIATALMIRWLAAIEVFADITVMVQKEVADRLGAAPGGHSYGRLSVIVQWRAAVERLFDVAPRAFTPPPKVTSTLVRLVPRPAPLAPCAMADLERITEAAFGQRRKMLRSALRSLDVDTEALLARCGIDPTARAETLTVEAFACLARALSRYRATG